MVVAKAGGITKFPVAWVVTMGTPFWSVDIPLFKASTTLVSSFEAIAEVLYLLLSKSGLSCRVLREKIQEYNNTLQINENNVFIRNGNYRNYNQVVCQHTLLKPDLPSPVGAFGLRGQLIPRMKWLPVALYKHCKPTGELRTNLLLSPTK